MNVLRNDLLFVSAIGRPKVIVAAGPISITESTVLFASDNGKSYSYDATGFNVELPLVSTLSPGWSIHFVSTVETIPYKLAPQGTDYMVVDVSVNGEIYDNCTMVVGADASVTFDGTKFIVVGTGVSGFIDD